MSEKKLVEKRAANARRVAAYRSRQRDMNLVSVMLPKAIADEIKAAGGIDTWLDIIRTPSYVEVVREVPANLTEDQRQLIGLGQKVVSLSGWKRKLFEL